AKASCTSYPAASSGRTVSRKKKIRSLYLRLKAGYAPADYDSGCVEPGGRVRTKRGYLATVLSAGVMVAGYLGILPLLQSLAAEPPYPDAPAAAPVAAAPVVASVRVP